MGTRALFPVALLGLAAIVACETAPSSSPTLSSGLATGAAFSAADVGGAVQQSSGQAFLLLDGSLTQMDSSASAQSTSQAPNDFSSVKTITWSAPCLQGGTKGVTGTVSVSRSNGSGVVNTDLLLTFTNCDIGRVILQGNPGVTLTGQTTFQNGIPDTHTFTKAGGLLFTVQSGTQGSVQFSCTVTWSRQTGVVSSTGTVTWEFPVGTPVPGPGCSS